VTSSRDGASRFLRSAPNKAYNEPPITRITDTPRLGRVLARSAVAILLVRDCDSVFSPLCPACRKPPLPSPKPRRRQDPEEQPPPQHHPSYNQISIINTLRHRELPLPATTSRRPAASDVEAAGATGQDDRRRKPPGIRSSVPQCAEDLELPQRVAPLGGSRGSVHAHVTAAAGDVQCLRPACAGGGSRRCWSS